jgi:hypothetical protein
LPGLRQINKKKPRVMRLFNVYLKPTREILIISRNKDVKRSGKFTFRSIFFAIYSHRACKWTVSQFIPVKILRAGISILQKVFTDSMIIVSVKQYRRCVRTSLFLPGPAAAGTGEPDVFSDFRQGRI